jgi:uncharacterized low-complexity protein
MKKLNASIITTAVLSTLAATTAVEANTNPFSVSELPEGYMQLAQADTQTATPTKDSNTKKAQGSCGEGKCGDMMNGSKMKKGQESACGEMMKGKEGKCGMAKKAKVKKPAAKGGFGFLYSKDK